MTLRTLWYLVNVQVGITVLQIQVYPKKNAPEVSKPPRVAKCDFLLILKIFSNLDDIQPSNKIFKIFLCSGALIAEKQKRTHKFEIFTIALTDKTNMENIFFLSQLMYFAEI